MHPLQWLDGDQTTDNITIIQTTPVNRLMTCEAEICMFVSNRSIVKMFLTSNQCFWIKYKSPLHNIAFSSEKVVSSESGEKYAQI